MKSVRYAASRDANDPAIWRDEDRAMAHASIVSNEPSVGKAKAALRAYILKEAAYLRKQYGNEAFFDVHRGKINDLEHWAAKRIVELEVVAKQIARVKFNGGKQWEAIDFDADKLRFRLIRIEREV